MDFKVKSWYNRRALNKLLINIAIFAFVLIAGAFFVFLKNKPDVIKEPIPSPQTYQSPTPTVTPKISPLKSELPVTDYELLQEINLAIPFTSQAPSKNWGLPYAEFCEEASSLMAASYINGWSIPTSEFAEEKMLEIKSFEEKRFGYYKDTTAEETAIILREFYNFNKVQILYNPTIDDIKKAVAGGKAVMAPMAGRLLGNPYFQSPGPIYHMLVIKGYTKEGNIITNDPGTRRGADFIYAPNIIMNAIHDWNGGDVDNGKKVVIIVG